MDELAEIRTIFFDECDELLDALDRHIQTFEAGQYDQEGIHGAFRAIHSIKGGAGTFALGPLIAFAHIYESTLDSVRSNRLQLSHDVVVVLRRSADRLADHVEAARTGSSGPGADTLEEELARYAGKTELVDVEKLFGPSSDKPAPAPAPTAKAPARAEGKAPIVSERLARIKLKPRGDLFRRAVEPGLLIKILKDFGKLKVVTDTSALPGFNDLEPLDCFLSWSLELRTDATLDVLVSALEPFLDAEEHQIEVEGGEMPGAAAPPAAAATPSKGAAAARTAPVPPEVPAPSTSAAGSVVPIRPAPPPAATTPATTAPVKLPAPPAANVPAASGEGRGSGSVRVDLNRIDRLVNLVGEIVVVQALLTEHAPLLDTSRQSAIVDAISALARRSRELHEAVMAVRAQPVKTVFQRMPRLVRELSQLLGKQARLVLTGEHTEVDKTIIEELAEPLTHMLRNSMDHGVETPEERLKAGKPAEGTIVLAADHRGARIVITVSDDGKGIDRERLLAKSIDRGLVPEGARLAPEEIDQLIFHPGLSTAEKISDVSGRGVGMDVVKRSIQAMGGRISVTSEPGKGCRFTLAMPLTLAVLDGMVLRIGIDRFVLPLQSVVETLRSDRQKIEQMPSGQMLLRLRDRLAPLLDLRWVLGLNQTPAAVEGDPMGVIIVAETDGGQQLAILADEILGQQQVVVKSLEHSYGTIPGISGASILGDGRVSLILDIDALPTLAGERPFDRALALQSGKEAA